VIAKVEELEQQEGIQKRWTPSNHQYQESKWFLNQRGFVAVVNELEGRVVQRLFELSKANLAGTGKKQIFEVHNTQVVQVTSSALIS
jgi:hypothetical protein